MALTTRSLLVAFLFASQSLAAPHVVKKDYTFTIPGASPTNSTSKKVKRDNLPAPHVVKKDYTFTVPGAIPSNSTSKKVKRDDLLTFLGFQYVSCYLDDPQYPTLQGPKTSDPGMTIEMCASFCSGKQHRHDLSSSLTR